MGLFLGPPSVQHSLIASEPTWRVKSWVWVRTETLDGLVSKLGLRRVDLKMDVEGAEVEILRKGKRTLGIIRKIAVAPITVGGGSRPGRG